MKDANITAMAASMSSDETCSLATWKTKRQSGVAPSAVYGGLGSE
jgi:hypothetical protein